MLESDLETLQRISRRGDRTSAIIGRAVARMRYPHQVLGQCRDQRAGQQKGPEESENDRFRHRPEQIAGSSGLPCSRCQFIFSSVTVLSSTRIPTASASPPSVIVLIVSPSQDRAVSENRIASGIVIRTMMVKRQLPRNSRIISPVSAAAMTPSRTTPEMADLMKGD